MTVQLFPRLDALAVENALASLDQLIAEARLPLREDRLPAGVTYAAVGGTRVGLDVLAALRRLIVDAAEQCGFPSRGSTNDRARFDGIATSALAGFLPLASGEADRDDVWAFISTILLPDVSAWRFHGRAPARFHGGVRNTFQRLWMRAWALDEGADAGDARWHLVEALTEDALVAITERPAIGADRRLSRAIARAWIATAAAIGQAAMQDVMRRAVIDLRIRNEIQMLMALEDGDLEEFVLAMFARAAGTSHSPGEEAAKIIVDAAVLDRRRPAALLAASTPISASGAARPPDGKTSEMDIQHAILDLMLDGEIWSNAELKARLSEVLPLTEADRGVGARVAEELWENRVNNALGRARGNSLYSKGFVENHGHGRHRITDRGRRYMQDEVDLEIDF